MRGRFSLLLLALPGACQGPGAHWQLDESRSLTGETWGQSYTLAVPEGEGMRLAVEAQLAGGAATLALLDPRGVEQERLDLAAGQSLRRSAEWNAAEPGLWRLEVRVDGARGPLSYHWGLR